MRERLVLAVGIALAASSRALGAVVAAAEQPPSAYRAVFQSSPYTPELGANLQEILSLPLEASQLPPLDPASLPQAPPEQAPLILQHLRARALDLVSRAEDPVRLQQLRSLSALLPDMHEDIVRAQEAARARAVSASPEPDSAEPTDPRLALAGEKARGLIEEARRQWDDKSDPGVVPVETDGARAPTRHLLARVLSWYNQEGPAPGWRPTAAMAAVFGGTLLGVFTGINHLNAQRALAGAGFLDLDNALDRAIPFQAGWIWVYLSWLPFCFLTATLLTSWRRLRAFSEAFALQVLAASAVFLLAPSRMLREPLAGNSLSELLVGWMRVQDPGFNCLPSLHVANAVLVALAFQWTGSRWRVWMWLWAALIIASTVFVKQHYLIDLPTGALLGALSALWASWRGGFGPLSRSPRVS